VKFSISQSELQNALSVVMKGVSSRSTLPVLGGILINASEGKIILQSTDLVMSIRQTCSALVEENGSGVFPARLFFDIIRNLNDAAVSISVEDETAEISCDTANFSIKTLNPLDFPEFPQVSTSQTISLPFNQFSQMVKRVGKVVSKDESRAILTGVLITAQNGLLKMVATDSYRLAITQFELENSEAEFEAVVSGSFLMDIAALPKIEKPLSLSLAESQIVVSYGDTVFINRRIEGTFPNYQQLLPNSYASKIKVSTSLLTAGVKRTSLMGTAATPVQFSIEPENNKLTLRASSQDIGSVEEIIPCEGEGEIIPIAFNCAYVLEGLSSIETEFAYIEAQSSLKPGIITSDKEENFLYLVMPVRIS